MKCQILFSGKNKKNIISLSYAEFTHSMESVIIMSMESVIIMSMESVIIMEAKSRLCVCVCSVRLPYSSILRTQAAVSSPTK